MKSINIGGQVKWKTFVLIGVTILIKTKIIQGKWTIFNINHETTEQPQRTKSEHFHLSLHFNVWNTHQ